MKRKLLTLCATLLVGIGTAFAESGWCGNMLLWTLKDSVLTIKGDGTMNDYSYSWGSCNTPWYNKRASIKAIVIENGCQNIGNYAFCGCNKATSITIGNSVSTIGNNAFNECNNLIHVTINSNGLVNKNHQYDNNFCTIFGNQVKEYILGNEITGIGNYAFYHCSNVESITISSNATQIGSNAFSGCSSLSSITLPEGVTNIDNNAFSGCVSLTSVDIPSSVINLSTNAFGGCSNLQKVTLRSNIITSASYATAYNIKTMFGSSVTEFILGEGVTSIGYCAFDGCNNLISLTLPSSLTTIDNYAFRNCTGLQEVHISDIKTWCSISFPNAETSPLYYAHKLYINEDLLTDFVVPDEVSSIGNFAFANCTSINSLSIPNSITNISIRAFEGCNNLELVILNSNQVSSNSSAGIFGKNVKRFVMGEDVNTIGNSFFYGCDSLKSITIPSSIITIENQAFTGCSKLSEVHISNIGAWCHITFKDLMANPLYLAHNLYLNDELITDLIIPDSVTSIRNMAFAGCNINSLTISKNVKQIGQDAFCVYTGLTNITWNAINCGDNGSLFNYNPSQIQSFVFGDEVKKIPAGLCFRMSNISSINIPNSVTKIGEQAFYGCNNITSLTIPNNVQNIGNEAFCGCPNLKVLTIKSNIIASATYTDENNLCNLFGQQISHCIIGDDITKIGDFAFFGCYGLTNLTVGKSVARIGEWTFYDCNLTSITLNSNTLVSQLSFKNNFGQQQGMKIHNVIIGDDVTTIGNHAFSDCEHLSSVKIGNNVATIEPYAFMMCFDLSSVIMSESISYIGEGAFDDCSSLSSITIPSQVTNIGNFTFSGCRNLSAIYNYATIPQPTTSLAFTNVDKSKCVLFVPKESINMYITASIWNEFTHILPIAAEQTEVTNTEISANDTSVEFKWQLVTDADTYELVIRDLQGNIIFSFVFDSNGMVISLILHSPSRNREMKENQVNGFAYTITGLQPGSQYNYTLTAQNELGEDIYTEGGSFSTNASTTNMENVNSALIPEKLLHNGQIFILRGEKVYTTTGQEVK